MNLEHYWDLVIRYGTKAGLMIIAALILWIVGRLLIRLVDKLLKKVMDKQAIDPTLTRYAVNVVNVALNIALVVAILGYFGVQTTTFAALIAGVGVALGLAWSGLLANFAAGAFLMILRPYKVGDFVQINDTMGTVEEIGLFFTGINTLNNDRIYHGNAKVLVVLLKTIHPIPIVVLSSSVSWPVMLIMCMPANCCARISQKFPTCSVILRHLSKFSNLRISARNWRFSRFVIMPTIGRFTGILIG